VRVPVDRMVEVQRDVVHTQRVEVPVEIPVEVIRDVVRYEKVMLWSAGIGVTPFASVLKKIRHDIEQGQSKIKKVDFYWVNRDQESFEWILLLLQDMEQKCPFLEINLYFTGTIASDKVKAIMMDDDQAGQTTDALTGLNSRTTYGRPDLDVIFAQKAQDYIGQKVGVFVCGPRSFSRDVYASCVKYTSAQSDTKFNYHKENF